MRNSLFYFFVGSLASLHLGACSDDAWQEDVAALKRPVPTGIVILDSSGAMAVKGTTFQLRFRVNPTGVSVSPQNLELDIRNSDTFFRYEPSSGAAAAAQSRASYVTPSDYYEIVSVEADTHDDGEPLEGQWIVTVATHGEGNFRNTADLCLIVNYPDAAGVMRKVSSQSFPVEIVPTADEGVEFRYSLVQNFRTGDGKLNPYVLQVDVNAYRNAAGKVWYYDRSFVTPAADVAGQGVTADFSALRDKHYIRFTPEEDARPWTGLDAGEVKKASVQVPVTLTDLGGTQKRLDLPVTYCPHEILLERNIPISELNANRNNLKYHVDFSDELADYGLTAEMSSQLTRISLMPTFDGGDPEHVAIEELELEGEDRTFRCKAYLWVMEELTEGFTAADEEIGTLEYVLSSFPQGLGMDEVQALLDVKIRIAINGVE